MRSVRPYVRPPIRKPSALLLLLIVVPVIVAIVLCIILRFTLFEFLHRLFPNPLDEVKREVLQSYKEQVYDDDNDDATDGNYDDDNDHGDHRHPLQDRSPSELLS